MTHLPKPNLHVIATAFDNGEGVLIDLQNKRYYQLNETGLLIWQELAAEHPREQVIAALMAAYEVAEEQAQASVLRLLNDLQQLELLSEK